MVSPRSPPSVKAPPSAPPVETRRHRVWDEDPQLTDDQLYAGGRHGVSAHGPYRRRIDQRGAFAAATSAVVLAAAFLPWYTTHLPTHPTANLFSHGFAGWLIFIPVAAGAGIALGVANALLHPADPGAVPVFVLLRVVILAQVVLVVVSIFVHDTHGEFQHVSVAAYWASWAAIGAAAAGLLGTAARRPESA